MKLEKSVLDEAQKKENVSIEEIESIFKFNLQGNKAILRMIFDKTNFLKNVINFCTKYDIIISEIISSSNNSKMKFDHLSFPNRENMSLNNSIKINFENEIAVDEWGISQCNI
jgi:hypothetical protein